MSDKAEVIVSVLAEVVENTPNKANYKVVFLVCFELLWVYAF